MITNKTSPLDTQSLGHRSNLLCAILRTRLLIIISISTFSFLSLAQFQTPFATSADEASSNPSPYLFSGSCSSQGSWTADALQQTQRLKEITMQLKDNPDCKALGNQLQNTYAQMYSNLSGIQQTMTGADIESAKLANDIKALRESSNLVTFAMNKISNIQIMKKLFDWALIKGQSNDLNNARPDKLSSEQRNKLLASYGDRITRVSSQGFSLFNQTLDSLPRLQNCLTDDTNVLGHVVSSSVSMLGALVSSGEDPLGNQTAMAISKLASVMRESKYMEIIAKLNQQEFMSSIQCIMETTTESYCAARDSRILFNEMKAFKSAIKDKSQPVPNSMQDPNSPLFGFYVITQFSPIITDWLFRIQIGATPRLNEDAAYQNRVLTNVNNFFTQIKTLQAYTYNTERDILSLTDTDSKKTAAKDLILGLTGQLASAGGVPGSNSMNPNFFNKAGSIVEIPFFLMGMDVPQQVISQGNQMTSDTWLNTNYKNLPFFNNPEKVPELVRANLEKVLEPAKQNMLSYYYKNFVVDQIAMVNESFIGLPYNVKNALYYIDQYLSALIKKIESSNGDQTLIGAITDTKIRIGKIFKRFNDLQDFVKKSKEFRSKRPTPEEEQAFKISFLDYNQSLIDEVYQQFDVLIAKSGLLANRLLGFAMYDFQNTARNIKHLGSSKEDQLFKELSYATGMVLYNRLSLMAGNNPALVEADFDIAMRIYKENLAAQEMLFSGSLSKILSQLRLSSKKPYIDSQIVTYDSIHRAYKDGWNKRPDDTRLSITRLGSGLWNTFKALTGFDSVKTKYPIEYKALVGIKNTEIFSVDDEFQSAKNLQSRLCTQALSFGYFNGVPGSIDPTIWNLCKDTVLKSPFEKSKIPIEFQNKYEEFLNVQFSIKIKEDLPDYRSNQSKRICAFRDYNRKNLLTYLAINSTENENSSTPTNEYSDNLALLDKIKPDPNIPSSQPQPLAEQIQMANQSAGGSDMTLSPEDTTVSTDPSTGLKVNSSDTTNMSAGQKRTNQQPNAALPADPNISKPEIKKYKSAEDEFLAW